MSDKQEWSDEDPSPVVMTKVLDWAYDKAVNGVPGFDSAEEMARD